MHAAGVEEVRSSVEDAPPHRSSSPCRGAMGPSAVLATATALLYLCDDITKGTDNGKHDRRHTTSTTMRSCTWLHASRRQRPMGCCPVHRRPTWLPSSLICAKMFLLMRRRLPLMSASGQASIRRFAVQNKGPHNRSEEMKGSGCPLSLYSEF